MNTTTLLAAEALRTGSPATKIAHAALFERIIGRTHRYFLRMIRDSCSGESLAEPRSPELGGGGGRCDSSAAKVPTCLIDSFSAQASEASSSLGDGGDVGWGAPRDGGPPQRGLVGGAAPVSSAHPPPST